MIHCCICPSHRVNLSIEACHFIVKINFYLYAYIYIHTHTNKKFDDFVHNNF